MEKLDGSRCFPCQPYLPFLCVNQSIQRQSITMLGTHPTMQALLEGARLPDLRILHILQLLGSQLCGRVCDYKSYYFLCLFAEAFMRLWCNFSLSPLLQSQIHYVHLPINMLGSTSMVLHYFLRKLAWLFYASATNVGNKCQLCSDGQVCWSASNHYSYWLMCIHPEPLN